MGLSPKLFRAGWISLALIITTFSALNAGAVEACRPQPGALRGVLQRIFGRYENPLGLARESWRYKNVNEVIYYVFDKWLDHKFNKFKVRETLPKDQLLELEREFAAEQEAIFEKTRPLLQEKYDKMLAEKIRRQRAFNPNETIEFNGREFVVVARLGGAKEGTAYLVEDGGKYVVIKRFHHAEDAATHKYILDRLPRKEVKTAQVLGIDPKRGSLMVEYVEGLVYSDIEYLAASKELPREFVHAFQFQHAKYFNETTPRVGRSLNAVTGNGEVKKHFYPHSDNVAFNPVSGDWVVFDPK